MIHLPTLSNPFKAPFHTYTSLAEPNNPQSTKNPPSRHSSVSQQIERKHQGSKHRPPAIINPAVQPAACPHVKAPRQIRPKSIQHLSPFRDMRQIIARHRRVQDDRPVLRLVLGDDPRLEKATNCQRSRTL